MTRRLLAPLLVTGLVAGVAVAPAIAGPKPKPKPKPITKSWAIGPLAPGAGVVQNPTAPAACVGEVVPPSSSQTESFKIPAAGILKVEVTGYTGDWDFIITDDKGKKLSESDNASVTPTNMATPDKPIVEKGTYKAKKAIAVKIVVCNFAGGPTGSGKYTFTYS